MLMTTLSHFETNEREETMTTKSKKRKEKKKKNKIKQVKNEVIIKLKKKTNITLIITQKYLHNNKLNIK
jgi:predicted solute-binding protein